MIKKCFVCLLPLFFSSFASAQNIIAADKYDYPNFDFTQATIATASINPINGAVWKSLKVRTQNRKIKGRRYSVSMRFFKPSKSCKFKNNQQKKRLILLLTGLGSEADSGQANYYANEYVKRCMSVLIVPSVFTKNFSIAASRSGVVGDGVEDMKDLYNLLIKSVKILSKENHFKSYSMFGYSLGALSAGFISEIDSRKRFFNFKSVLMANSPLDLMYGMQTLDKYASYRNDISAPSRLNMLSVWGANVLSHKFLKTNVKNYSKFIRRMGVLKRIERKAIIGKFLKGSLHDVVLTSQDVVMADHGKDLGVLPPKRNLVARRRASDEYDFKRYIEKIVLLYNKKFKGGRRASFRALNASNSLYSIESYLKRSNHIYMMHSADDFLLRPEETNGRYLARVFGDRLFFYPRGGHCGNLWFGENLAKMLEILTQ